MFAPPVMLATLLSIMIIISDLCSRRVPNIWLLGSIALGACMLLTTWLSSKSGPPWPALLGLLVGFAALLPFHIFGWMGAGDVKFFAVLGFLLGTKALLPIWIIGSLIAGAQSALILLSQHWLSRTMPAWEIAQTRLSSSTFGQRMIASRQGRKGLPYAAWLGAGTLVVIFNPALMHW